MPREKAHLVAVKFRQRERISHDEIEREMTELIGSAGGSVCGLTRVSLDHPSPSLFIREGKLAEIAAATRQSKADMIIFSCDLTPVQARNLEAETGLRIVDRTGLILDIFARRAQSRDGKLQVELAQLEYLMPRLVGKGVIMSRLGGGIGTRGPGEQKLEVDKRKIRDRIRGLKKDLEKLKLHRQLLRRGREAKKFFQIAIVGYTNTGKSTLLNVLTGSSTYAQDKLFATLDPKTRILNLKGRRDILFTDTVGFIRDLPHGLVDAFQATLEETAHADLLLHVLDASSENIEAERIVVEKTLAEIHAGDKPAILVLNKTDKITGVELRRLCERYPDAVPISAQEGTGLDALLSMVSSFCPARNTLTDGNSAAASP